jgi:hypothetical protein
VKLKVLVFDGARDPRTWADYCGRPVTTHGWADSIAACVGDVDIDTGVILIMHGLPNKKRYSELASELSRLCGFSVAICVSGLGSDGQMRNGVYWRRTILGGRAGEVDDGFVSCFRRFAEHFERTGVWEYGLLEPPAWPPHLVALYLLGIAPPDVARQGVAALGKKQLEGLVREAWAEHAERKGTVEAWNAAGLPKCWNANGAFEWTEEASNWSDRPTFHRERLRECLGSP